MGKPHTIHYRALKFQEPTTRGTCNIVVTRVWDLGGSWAAPSWEEFQALATCGVYLNHTVSPQTPH